jgi:hypothetical protein
MAVPGCINKAVGPAPHFGRAKPFQVKHWQSAYCTLITHAIRLMHQCRVQSACMKCQTCATSVLSGCRLPFGLCPTLQLTHTTPPSVSRSTLRWSSCSSTKRTTWASFHWALPLASYLVLTQYPSPLPQALLVWHPRSAGQMCPGLHYPSSLHSHASSLHPSPAAPPTHGQTATAAPALGALSMPPSPAPLLNLPAAA